MTSAPASARNRVAIGPGRRVFLGAALVNILSLSPGAPSANPLESAH